MESDDSEDGNRCIVDLTAFIRIYMAYLQRYMRCGYAFLCFERVRI